MTKQERDKQYYEKNKEKIKIRALLYYKNNRSSVLSAVKKYRENNPEKVKANQQKWLQENSQYHVVRVKAWRESNPDKLLKNRRTWHANRRARLYGAQGSFSYENWLKKVEYHGWKCFYCKVILIAKTLTMDHRKPLAKGGSNWLANLVPACKSCNSRKHAIWE